MRGVVGYAIRSSNLQPMSKLIRCVVALENWETIVSSVASVGTGVTVYHTRENNPDRNRIARYRGREYQVHLPGMVVEIIADDSWVTDIIVTIERAHKNS